MSNQDPELEELLRHPLDRQVIELLRASRPAAPPLDPDFRSQLRMKLVGEARRVLTQTPPRPWLSLTFRPRPALVAVAAGFLVVLMGGIAYQKLNPPVPSPIEAITTSVDRKSNVAIAEPIKIGFRGPVDKNAVAQTVDIQPAARYTTRWEGQTLVIIPLHPLTSSTGYTLTVVPSAGQPAAPSQPQPSVVVRFVTAPSPPPPVVPPVFRSDNLTFLGESRIAEPGKFGSYAWAPDGQALAISRLSIETSASPGTASPSETPGTAARAVSSTEVWLMSPQGTLVRRLGERASEPSVAPAGGQFAFWREEGQGGASLMVASLDGDGSNALRVATLPALPEQPPAWLGSDRLAFVSGGMMKIVDLQGTAVAAPPLRASGRLAGSPDGRFLAVETPDGALLYDVRTSGITALSGATSFAWSARADLAYVVTQGGSAVLSVLPHESTSTRQLVSSTAGDTWSELNWAPDARSLLLISRQGSGGGERAYLVNADGSGGLVPFGNTQQEYTAPRWSPLGTAVVFVRRDETGRAALWTAGVAVGQPSAADQAQLAAESEVDRFMRSRLQGQIQDSEAELGPDALTSYRALDVPLTGRPDPYFARYYPVGVQFVSPDKFFIGVRIVLADARSKLETSFFEEHLTVIRHDQRFRIDAVETGATIHFGQGPHVVSVVEVRPQGNGEAPARQLLVRFDADLDPATVSRGSVFVRSAAGDRIAPVDFKFNQTAHQVTLTLPKLNPGKYQLVASTGVSDVKGQPLAPEYASPLVVEED